MASFKFNLAILKKLTVIIYLLLSYSTVFGAGEAIELPSVTVTDRADKSTERRYDEPLYSRLSLPESSTAETVYTAKDIEMINPGTVYDMIELAPNVMRTFSNSMSPHGLTGQSHDFRAVEVNSIGYGF